MGLGKIDVVLYENIRSSSRGDIAVFERPKDSTFRARIASQGGLVHLDCYVDEKNEDGSPLYSRIVDENPPGPLPSRDQAQKLAVELARLYGFRSDEIVWENE